MPAFPAYAIMCAGGLQKILSRWCKFYFEVMIPFVVIMALAILTGFQLITGLLPDTMPAAANKYMATFSSKNMISGAGLVLCLFLLRRSGRLPFSTRIAAMLALFCIAAFASR
jgi:hypothetical protein